MTVTITNCINKQISYKLCMILEFIIYVLSLICIYMLLCNTYTDLSAQIFQVILIFMIFSIDLFMLGRGDIIKYIVGIRPDFKED
jgi:hypothetical protein